MRCQWTLLAFFAIGLALSSIANADTMKYVSQQRIINANFNWQTQQQSCNQSASAPDFEPFDESVDCLYADAAQDSTLGPHTITTLGNADTNCGLGCAQAPGALSRLSVDFQIVESAAFSIRGTIFGIFSNGSEVKLTGPGGIIAQHSNSGPSTVPVNTCGTLAPGQYNFFVRSSGGSGADANHNVTLRVIKPGDITLDDAVNVDDLLAVINAWGPCASPQNCDVDLTCDGAANVDDLLIVINNWG